MAERAGSGRARDERATRDRSASTSSREPGLDSVFGFQLGRAHRAVRGAWERRIADLGLSAPQSVLLRAVCEWPGSGLREVARRTRTDAMNARRLLERLAALGLVSSGDDPVHRQRRVLQPTAAGVEVAGEIARRAREWDHVLERALGRDGTGELRALLARLEEVAALEEAAYRRQEARRRAAPGAGSVGPTRGEEPGRGLPR